MKLYLLVSMAIFFSIVQSCNNHKPANASKLGSMQYDTIMQLIKKDSATIVDVRTSEEYKEGHIKGSINIPLGDIANQLSLFKNYENIIVVCKSGKRSEKAKTLLTEKGFNNVFDGGGQEKLKKALKQ